MARVLTITAAVTTGGSGCLVAQDDRLLPGDPTYFNHAPRLINVNPSFPYIEINDESDCELQFSVNVADPDLDQTIRVRYYVNYDPNSRQGFEREFVLTNTGQEERPETVVFETNLGAPDNPLAGPNKIHIVEAIAYDGTLSPTRVPEPLSVTADGGLNPSYSDVHQWVVNNPGTVDCRPQP